LGNDSLTGRIDADALPFDALPNAATNRDTVGDFNVLGDTIGPRDGNGLAAQVPALRTPSAGPPAGRAGLRCMRRARWK